MLGIHKHHTHLLNHTTCHRVRMNLFSFYHFHFFYRSIFFIPMFIAETVFEEFSKNEKCRSQKSNLLLHGNESDGWWASICGHKYRFYWENTKTFHSQAQKHGDTKLQQRWLIKIMSHASCSITTCFQHIFCSFFAYFYIYNIIKRHLSIAHRLFMIFLWKIQSISKHVSICVSTTIIMKEKEQKPPAFPHCHWHGVDKFSA